MDDDNLPSVSDKSEINDSRQASDFTGISFSNYKKAHVRKQFIESMINGKLEPACYWCAELVCAGHFMEIWDIILHYAGKHIHIGNPKIIIYLEKRFLIFRGIIEQGQFTREIQLRNHPTIRQLFAEIVCTLTLSNRKLSFEPIKIKREDEFDMTQMADKLKAPTIHYADNIMRKDDPYELIISIMNSWCL